MTTSVQSLASWLLERITEDEAALNSSRTRWLTVRLRADCEAKRRIVNHCVAAIRHGSPGVQAREQWILQLLAERYANHPDFPRGMAPMTAEQIGSEPTRPSCSLAAWYAEQLSDDESENAERVRVLSNELEAANREIERLQAALAALGKPVIERGHTHNHDIPPRVIDPHSRMTEPIPNYERTVYRGPWRRIASQTKGNYPSDERNIPG